MNKAVRALLIMLSVVLVFACSTLVTSRTSLVTISLRSDMKTASVDIKQTTLWATLKTFFANNFHVSAALAAIPSNVVSVSLTVRANDMVTITKTADTTGLNSVSFTVEVPNGINREFVVMGFDATSAVAYWGHAFADLNGNPMSLPINMINFGSVTNILYVSAKGDDITGDGTQAMPFRSITRALTASTASIGNDAILVEQGTYDATSGEVFPLQLNPATALVCLGSNHSSVIDGTSSTIAIYGDTGAIVDNCRIIPGCDATAIDDRIGGATPAPTTINQVLIDQDPGGGFPCPPWDAIILSADSTVNNVSYVDVWSSFVYVNSGNPTIKNTTILGTSNSSDGIYVLTGNPLIQNNTIIGSSSTGSGIYISTGSPTIDGNTINWGTAGTAGIYVFNGAPLITRNTITNNNTGISVFSSTANPTINNNSIYCNISSDLSTTSLTLFDASNNSWDHDAATTPAGPTISGTSCTGGVDICYSVGSPAPLFDPFGPAVPGGCL